MNTTATAMNDETNDQQSEDIARSWVKVSHWTDVETSSFSRHLIINSRTIVREYTVEWIDRKPIITDTPVEYSRVGEVSKAVDLKAQGYKRHAGGLMYNEITREMSAI